MPSKKSPVRLAIVGTGGMAGNHARRFHAIPGCKVVAAVDINRARLEAFAAEHGIPNLFNSVDELLAWNQFDAVTIVTPDAFHATQSIRCLKAGKHVLCEKPLALNHADAMKMVTAARKAGVINMVKLSSRD